MSFEFAMGKYRKHRKKVTYSLKKPNLYRLFSSIKVKKLPQQSRFKILTMLGKALDRYASGNICNV